MHGKNSSALSMLEKIPRNVTADSDIVTTDSEKIEKSVTINRNERSRCVGIRNKYLYFFKIRNQSLFPPGSCPRVGVHLRVLVF
uniref:Uncharacterized protein n=1 Tax=Candidatus Kentrum sp. SD TaxID=2126332 RepID=A0A450Z890_9GAMM|nr:MAG: hypothetical protein BECKSD772F_GA0070984_14112 [Candidatus Kentron sp. SD]VFK50020.1 MAG: hypothetical protein BECKSD772E_GA0070983_13252 [Candidatus Kentron sp. SD]